MEAARRAALTRTRTNLQRRQNRALGLNRKGSALLSVLVGTGLLLNGWPGVLSATEVGVAGSPLSEGRSVINGIASYYGKGHHGKKTANGETFDMHKLTAAHRSLPFGSRVKVTNLSNNRSIVVRINDRGPFVAGRIIDLSQAAAEQLEMIREGIVGVKLEVLESPGARELSVR